MSPPCPSEGRRPRRRRVAVVTGTRAEYGLLRGPMQAIARHPRLDLQLVVTGMHLLKACGMTVRQIERDGWRIDARVPMQSGRDNETDQANGLASGIKGIAAFLDRARSDVVLVLGDRIEAMAGALAGVTTGRIVAHIHGGDLAPGDIDGSLRHAITKLAHIHLVASRDAARRVIKMGEAPDHVHVVGAPGLDRLFEIISEGPPARDPSNALIVYHPCGRRPDIERRAMNAVLRAVHDTGLNATVIHPNTDRGHSGVTRALEEFTARQNGNAAIRVVRSLPRDRYLRELLAAAIIVGNSSSGIIEAAAAGVPCVNVGDRQLGRLPASRQIIHAGESYRQILLAIDRARTQRPKRPTTTPLGDGSAGTRIAEVLAKTPLTERIRRKK